MKNLNTKLLLSSTILLILLLLVTVYWGNVKNRYFELTGIENSAEATKLVVGTNLWMGYESFYLARDLGFYNDTPIRFVEHLSATQQIRAFRNRVIQATTLTLDEVLLLLEHGHDPRVVMVIDISHGGDVIIGNSYIKNLKDLRGRRVALENTAVGGYLMARALELAELTPKDITMVPLQVNELEKAFMDGKVDAVVTFEPMKSRLLARGARLLFDSSQIPGEIVDVLVVPSEILELYPDEIEIILRGWFRATKYLHEYPKDAAQRMSARLKISPSDVLIAFEGLQLPSVRENLEMMASSPSSPLLMTARKLAEHMIRNGLLVKEIDLNQFLAPKILQRLKMSNAEFL